MASDVITNFIEAVYLKLDEANQKYSTGLTRESVQVECNIRGRVAGRAIRRRGVYQLRFNLEAVLNYTEEMTKDTIPHEVAHLVCFVNPQLGNGHDVGWKQVCRSLGGDDSRTHDMLLTPVRHKEVIRYSYNVMGTIISVGPRQHKHIQDQTKSYSIDHPKHGRCAVLHYMWMETGISFNHDERKWEKSTTPLASKKDRALAIWRANPELTRAEMIDRFVNDADMTKAGAATYYQNFKSGKI